jgi:hypothetical protein
MVGCCGFKIVDRAGFEGIDAQDFQAFTFAANARVAQVHFRDEPLVSRIPRSSSQKASINERSAWGRTTPWPKTPNVIRGLYANE